MTIEKGLWAAIVATIFNVSLGCTQVVTLYWSKPGAGTAELLADKEECQALQRSVGLDEDRIEKCLEAQGWTPVRQETGKTLSNETENSKPSKE